MSRKNRYHVLSRVKHFVFKHQVGAEFYLAPEEFSASFSAKDPDEMFDLVCQCDDLESATTIAVTLDRDDRERKSRDRRAALLRDSILFGGHEYLNLQPRRCHTCHVAPCVCETLKRLKLDPWTPISGPSDVMPSVMDDLAELICPVSPLSDFSVKIDRKITARELYGMIDPAPAPMPVVIHMPCKGLDNGCVCDNCVPF